MLLILVLGFASGLPLALSFATLSAWLALEGVERTAIGLFALAGLPYALKFLWAPLIDGLRLPWLSRRLGRRRGWLLFSQCLLALAILGLGLSDPGKAIGVTAVLALTVAFLSATQDIVIDAYRVEILETREQGAGAAAVQLGYRGGMLVSGAGALFLADAFGWAVAYGAMALALGIGMAATLLAREPVAEPAPAQGAGGPPVAGHGGRVGGFRDWIGAHVVAPFADFARRPGWLAVVLFIVFYKFGDAIAGVMANPFFIDLGFTLSEIAAVTKLFGTAATLTGVVIGGLVVARYGVLPALMGCGILQMISNLMFVLQALVGADLALLTVTIGIENLSGGMGTAAFVAYLSALCQRAFTATQYALFSSLAAVGRTVLSSGGGWLADQLDWVLFFLASTACAIPGLLLLAWLMRRPDRSGLPDEITKTGEGETA